MRSILNLSSLVRLDSKRAIVFLFLTHIFISLHAYKLKMQNTGDFNEQHAWGGSSYHQQNTGITGQTTFVGRQGSPAGSAPPHAGILASASDDIFHPNNSFHNPPSLPYKLPDIPFPHHHPTYPYYPHIPINREFLSQPPVNHAPLQNHSTSYNNPTFVIPPPLPNTQNNPQFSHPSTPPPPHILPFNNHPGLGVPPVQYVYYVPHPSSQPQTHTPPLPSPTKALPSISHLHVPTLSNKSDFSAWDDGVTSSLRAHGLLGHILDPTMTFDSARPDRIPCPMPILPLSPTATELDSLTRWWDEDNVAQHILTSRLGTVPRGLLPSSNLVARTALSIYQTLVRYYGTSSFADCTELFDSLNTLSCQPGRVQEYVSHWRTGISRLQSAKFPFSIKVSISHFIRGLPLSPAFHMLRSQLPVHIAAAGDQDYGAFVTITESALELDTIFKSATHISRPPRNQYSVPTTITDSPTKPVVTPTIPDKSAKPALAGSSKTCTNCGLTGHLASTCFKPGGGMAGQRDEFRRNQSQIIAMMIASLDEAYDVADVETPGVPSPPSPPTPPENSSVVSSVSPTMSPQNDNIHRDWYPMRESREPLAFSTSNDVDHMAFFSLSDRYNTCLDSGCTDHIIRDRKLFANYDTTGAVDVGTANCGSLSAKASRDVSFRLPYGDRCIVFTLRGCLHAPDAPINLISVGALNENRLTVTFHPDAPTTISYPLSDPDLPGFVFTAAVHRRLSFLSLDFCLPATSVALPAATFPKTILSSTLWHRRFGHLGMDATREALTKDYATGLQFSGPFPHEHCVACIVGKSPQHPYAHNGKRASMVGDLLHMDMCGPYPVQTPDGKRHFFVILDDCMNFGFIDLLRLRNEAFLSYRRVEARLLRSSGVKVKTVRLDGALELTKGPLGDHFTETGITVQQTAPYAHQQNGKIERYVRTIEEGGQTLLADSGLPMTFWGWAVLTSQYLRNRLPTSTLPTNMTPFEAFSHQKPDLSHLRVWGCQCFVTIPPELRTKAGPRRFEAIFVGYEEARIGWTIRDLKGKVHFSRDVIFNEDLSGRLGIPRSPSVHVPDQDSPLIPIRSVRDRIRTIAGRDYDEALRLRNKNSLARTSGRPSRSTDTAMAVATDGGASTVPGSALLAPLVVGGVMMDGWHLSEDLLGDFVSYVASSQFPDPVDTFSLTFDEPDILWNHSLLSFPDSSPSILLDPVCLLSENHPHFVSKSPDLSKAPRTFSDAMARPDADAWRAAMDREKTSLKEMGAFEEVDLPKGERTIGLKWVFAYKKNSEGVNILEKARVVAQGFNQKPGQFDETYAPVAKMTSIRILLTWAAVRDLDIYQFDCKTAFLHAKIRHPIFARQFPGYTFQDSSKVLRVKVALYGLRQSAYEFYNLLMSLILGLGLIRCEVDHGIFFGEWTSPPDPSISMPPNGDPLVLYVPVHVDDGLAIVNSPLLYHWFLTSLRKNLLIVDLGVCSKFLSIVITRDRSNRRLWLSSHLYVAELIHEWNLTNAKYPKTPFPSNITDQQPVPGNAVPQIHDNDLTTQYQRVVGCLMYLAVTTCPDIAYYAMWLGRFSATPTRFHMLTAKHVLRYLGGTQKLALTLGHSSSTMPDSFRAYIQNMGCSDSDWASDTVDRRSVSGYSFFFQGSLISWSAVRQRSIALSSTEAEYYAMSHAFKEALWLRVFLGSLHLPVPSPFPILSDNQAACSLSNSIAISACSKHIDICHHFIRAHVQDGSFSTTWIPTTDMPADIFTKPLDSVLFLKHRAVLGPSIPTL